MIFHGTFIVYIKLYISYIVYVFLQQQQIKHNIYSLKNPNSEPMRFGREIPL